MNRSYVKELIKWSSKPDRKPLILWGARQVGKTYLAKELFAKKYFKNNYIYIDCKIEDDIRDFCLQTADAGRIIEYISLTKNFRISEKTLLIFDEIQECPNLISALKYFCQDFRGIPVIATGSMVRIKLQREMKKSGTSMSEGFLFPVGKINQLTLYPMSFDEFLYNANELLYESVERAFNEKRELTAYIHSLAMDFVYKYLLIGGMPEVVAAYIGNEDIFSARAILTELYDNYLSDMELYQASREAILRSQAVFSNIYGQLNREAKNFSPSLIEKNKKRRDFETAINWLTLAHIINQSFQLREHITMPLIRQENAAFRLFLGDMGMFAYQSGINAASFISNERENTLAGIFFENFIANELTAKGHPLYYWRGKSTAELEFIVEAGNELYPIDVKKGRGTLNSLEKFGNHNKYKYAIKVSKNQYGYNEEKRLMTLPFYYFPFMAKELAGMR